MDRNLIKRYRPHPDRIPDPLFIHVEEEQARNRFRGYRLAVSIFAWAAIMLGFAAIGFTLTFVVLFWTDIVERLTAF